MNLPNAITVFRLVLTVVFVIAVSLEDFFWSHVALASFSLAAVTDYLDGYLARKLNLVTSLGKLLDPLADKILVCSGFIYLTVESSLNGTISSCPLWVTCLILGREFMVTGLRQIAVEQGEVLAADSLGKWKTTFQLIFLIGVLSQLSFGSYQDAQNPIVKAITFLSDKDHYLIPCSLWLALALTVISGWNYLWSSRKLLKK